MAAQVLAAPAAIGALLAGGIYAGRIFVGDEPFALVAAPKAGGEFEDVEWGVYSEIVQGALSNDDGFANTTAMVTAGSQLARDVRALQLGGHADWYLPSRLEALAMFVRLQELPTGDFARDWYWTSTQVAGDAGYAWLQGFLSGHQYHGGKDWSCRARAVRRVPIRSFDHSVIAEAA
ncbi:MAG: DUF1566 domain-containing protein [Burkholderiales bacterium]|nr:DUF1566 domain-containing protein [Burkholderiales bacterium]